VESYQQEQTGFNYFDNGLHMTSLPDITARIVIVLVLLPLYCTSTSL
jgi:hypothetical protein